VATAAPIDAVTAVADQLAGMLALEMPFGGQEGLEHRPPECLPEPGDRVVSVTDGRQEPNAVELDVTATPAAGLHPREVVHPPVTAVGRATGGQLADDATAECPDRYDGPRRPRVSDRGAAAPASS